MDTIEKVTKILTEFLEYYEQAKPDSGEVSFYKIIDLLSKHFLLIVSGLENEKFIYRVIFHFHIIEDSLHILRNTTDLDLEKVFQGYGIRIYSKDKP